MGVGAFAFYSTFYMTIHAMHSIENELKKRWKYPYKWYQKQNNLWDTYTNFIYKTPTWEELVAAIANTVATHKLDKKACFYYASNRWYNFWSAMAVETLFCKHPEVQPAKNPKDKQMDFYLHNIPFDHKTSVFPKRFGTGLDEAKSNPEKLLYWLYNHQSQQGRKHLANRLFVVVFHSGGAHWKLKAEISLIEQAIIEYITTFDAKKMKKLVFPNGKTAVSDIIWVTQ